MKSLSPSRQIGFHQLLVAARKTCLMDALSEALGHLDPKLLKKQISDYVPADVQRILASAGIRDEHVFPVPAVLEEKPTLIGYYRLLLGISQKRFYRSGTGMGPLKGMEERGHFNPKRRPPLESFCTEMSQQLAELVRQIPRGLPRGTLLNCRSLLLAHSSTAAITTRSAGRQP
jgi:hypothetical protein